MARGDGVSGMSARREGEEEEGRVQLTGGAGLSAAPGEGCVAAVSCRAGVRPVAASGETDRACRLGHMGVPVDAH